MAKAHQIAQWMRSRLSSAAARGFVVGLSGGVDSAVVARLAQMAAPGGVIAALLPCHSDPQDEQDAMSVATLYSLPTIRIDLSTTYDTIVADAEPALRFAASYAETSVEPSDPLRSRAPAASIKPRLRMTSLYFVANTLNYLVAGTGNRSELAIGYFTKYGDGGVDLLPIGHLLKREVRELARELRVPDHIVNRPPSAGLWPGQTDEEEMGFGYAELERYLEEGPQAIAPALAMRIERLTRQNDHKRVPPPMPDEQGGDAEVRG
jgi:NAD+ synthase